MDVLSYVFAAVNCLYIYKHLDVSPTHTHVGSAKSREVSKPRD